MVSSPRVFICAPTFKEPSKILFFIQSLNHINYRPLTVLISNANPGDESESIITKNSEIVDYDLRQINGLNSEFWSGTINRALNVASQEANDEDWIVMMNVDILFSCDIISKLLENALKIGFPCQVGALFYSDKKVVSSGVKVKSWMLGINRHPWAGSLISEVPDDYFEEMDFLPSRCLLFPSLFLKKAGLVLAKQLPHYGADYEFTRRLINIGCKAYLIGDARIESDLNNSGNSVYSQKNSFLIRLKKINSIRNSSNLIYRTRFISLTYPIWAMPSAILSYLIRTIIETVLGGERIRKLFSKKERGFS
jgi:GT2 family glycosyltransferase